MQRWVVVGVLAFLAICGAVAVATTGDVLYLAPFGAWAAIVLLAAAGNALLARRVRAHEHGRDGVLADADEPLPASHLVPDGDVDAGDHPEVRDEIHPNDLPPGHPSLR